MGILWLIIIIVLILVVLGIIFRGRIF